MTTPVVVYGTPVSNPHEGTTTSTAAAAPAPASATTDANTFGGKGEKQETRCRDPIFAILLYGNVAAIAAVAGLYGPDALSGNDADPGQESTDYTGYVIGTIIIAFISLAASALGVAAMMRFPETLIKAGLIFTIIMTAAWAIASFALGAIGAGVVGLVFFAISICYARVVWPRIPFASVNLVTGTTAIKANWGVLGFAYLFTLLAVGWSILWAVAFTGVYDQTYGCNVNNNCSDVNYGYLFLLFVAYFFTHQVLENCVHVTVAGTVGTFWFSPSEASHCCSQGVINSFVRTVTTSFGSICFGSLIVAIIEALRMLANAAQANDDGGILVCIAECILACLAAIVEYFNKWAFIYVGLYGYSYLEAGKNVFTLFKNRGWEAIIADDLVQNTLFMISLIVGACMGGIAVLIEVTSDLFEVAGDNSKWISFALGLVVGFVVCSIAMSVIGSSVNAVIVLFAEAPAEFQQNYPELSNRMRETWSQIYPGSV